MLRTCAASLPAVVVALTAGCGPKPACAGDEAPPAVPVASTAAGFLPYGHSHNDYEQDRPLQQALDADLYSVEADLWLDGEDIVVKHDAWALSVGTLQELYLDPLQALIDDRGSVHGDGVVFTLWLDLKDGSPAMTDALTALLSGYDMATTFSPTGTLAGGVTVALTGDASGKERMVQADAPRPFARDDNAYAPDDPPADDGWRFYALSWNDYVPYGGDGAPTDDAARRLACIVDHAHDDGRKVRFYAAPQTEAAWAFQLDTGVDYVETDDVEALGAFLGTYSP